MRNQICIYIYTYVYFFLLFTSCHFFGGRYSNIKGNISNLSISESRIVFVSTGLNRV